jgi:lycopene cyclase domain-containing protein
MRHWTYLLLLLACLGATIPLEFVFHLRVLRRPATLIAALLPEFVLFMAWDIYAIRRHQWSYDPRRIIGVHLPGGVPLEEALFFVVIPVCAVLTFEAVKRCRAPRRPPVPAEGPPAGRSGSA